MASMTFDDITIELKEANIRLDSIDNNIDTSNEFLNLSIDTFKKGFNELLSFFMGDSLAKIERDREQTKFNKDMLAALQDLRPRYTGPDRAAEPRDADFGGLGGLLTGLAVVIGSVIGVIRGQLAAIKAFAKALMPIEWIDKIRKVFTSFVVGLSMSFDVLKTLMMDKLASIGRFLASTFDDVIKFFSGESRLFSGIKNAFTTLFQPFKELFSMVKGLMSGPFAAVGEMFSSISASLGKFGSLIGKVAGIVGKLFLPLTIVMTVWDTVKGMIEGFEKDGIIGGITGAIKGFFNSLIFGPADMLKDAAAWVLGFFGFDKAKEFLNSFSFEDIFAKLIDGLFFPLMQVQKLLGKAVDFLADAGAKLISFMADFEIPSFSILGRQFGPWKPFSGMKSDATTATQTTQMASGPGTTSSAIGVPSSGMKSDATTATQTTQMALAPMNNVSSRAGQSAIPSLSGPGTTSSAIGVPSMTTSSATGMALQSGDQLQTAIQEKGMLNAAPVRPAGSSGAGGVQQNNSTTVVNNSTVVVKPIPSASRRPNNSEDLFFGGGNLGYA